MILETWLILDYAVRDLTMSGFGLNKFCSDEFDLRYELLPEFRKLLQLLKNTVSYQSGLGLNPSVPNDYPPYIYSNYSFLKYLRDNHGDINTRLKEIEREFFAKQHPELAEQINQSIQFFFPPKEEEVERLPSGWLDVVNNLSGEWYDLAEKLNSARNIAAHSYDQSTISKKYGIMGPRTAEMVRAKCLELLNQLLGITLGTDGGMESEKPRNFSST